MVGTGRVRTSSITAEKVDGSMNGEKEAAAWTPARARSDGGSPLGKAAGIGVEGVSVSGEAVGRLGGDGGRGRHSSGLGPEGGRTSEGRRRRPPHRFPGPCGRRHPARFYLTS